MIMIDSTPNPIVIGKIHSGGTTHPVHIATNPRMNGVLRTNRIQIARSGITGKMKKKIDPMTAYSCAAQTSGGLTDIDSSLKLGMVSVHACTYK